MPSDEVAELLITENEEKHNLVEKQKVLRIICSREQGPCDQIAMRLNVKREGSSPAKSQRREPSEFRSRSSRRPDDCRLPRGRQLGASSHQEQPAPLNLGPRRNGGLSQVSHIRRNLKANIHLDSPKQSNLASPDPDKGSAALHNPHRQAFRDSHHVVGVRVSIRSDGGRYWPVEDADRLGPASRTPEKTTNAEF